MGLGFLEAVVRPRDNFKRELFRGFYFEHFTWEDLAMKKDDFKGIRKVLWIILFANLSVAFLKIIIGSMIKSTSMTADGVHSLSDGSSNIVGLIGIRIASKPVDEDHPYGHKKFENLSAMFIAIMLVFVGGKIIVDAVGRILNPVLPIISIESIAALAVTLVVNIFVCSYEYKKGKNLNSQILVSDSIHTRSDVFISIGVLSTLTCIRLGAPMIIDPIVSLVVSGFILHAAYEIFNSTSSVLVDKAVVDAGKIKEIAMGFEEVKDAHDIRSRGSEDDLYIDMHIVLDSGMNIEESHSLIHSIENRIKEDLNKNTQVIVHLEPFNNAISIGE
jgi:cation diffusion facilitator family transporter